MAFRYMVLKNGWLIFNYGTGIANFRASTGRPGISDPSIEDMGPIPPGRYIIIPSEISDVDYRKYKEGTFLDTGHTFQRRKPTRKPSGRHREIPYTCSNG